MEPEELFERPYKGHDATAGLTMAEFAERLTDSKASLSAKRASVRICRAYGICGLSDPGYIANVIQAEQDRDKAN